MTDAARQPKPATEATRRSHQRFRELLDFEDRRSFEDAQRGFLASLEPMTIAHGAQARAVLDLEPLAFLDGEAPDTVNPSLWRMAQLNTRHHGLYEVVDGIYQIRSFDIANMTLVRGETGWIVIDPLTSAEAAAAGLRLANETLGERPVVAVIHTHSHIDHYGGVLGVITAEQAASGEVPVLAPPDYVNEALSENVVAGNAMLRRATYMYGVFLPPSPTGFVTNGLGVNTSAGSVGFVVPNDTIMATGETRVLDGVEIEFQLAMGSEAPSEMVFYFPRFRALCTSEITSHHLHNVYTPRGAQVRDALAWSQQIGEMIERYGDRLEVQFASHHWPIWGREDAVAYLEKQQDLYKFVHDQTLRLANHGYTKEEIAEQLELPAALGREFFNRDYYGTLYANARAVYVKYLGFFDGNPATLHPLPPREAGARYLAYMGGADAVVERARADFEAGDYRWVVEVLNHVIMAEPGHEAAKLLQADALEQLGYQSESGPWRHFYLTGARELRSGLYGESWWAPSPSVARNMPLENVYQLAGVRLNAKRADGVALSLNLAFSDAVPAILVVRHSVLHVFPDRQAETADATLRLAATDLKLLLCGVTTAEALAEEGRLQIEGDQEALTRLLSLLDRFPRWFPIVTPRD
ncbi:MAG: alkyl sulfatase dimerization domain-containing protein [Pseudomonadales bacterium]|nr:alkyl sulfatase dimerization domain-containing protein [Pseudomonadales bacterium]